MTMSLTNLFRICLIVFLLIGCGLSTNSQVSPKPVLVDEFGRIECEDLSARLDVFIAELNKHPNATGYIAISSTHKLDWRERFIDGYARYRAFDENRLLIVRANLKEPTQTQMWSVPFGAELPVERILDTSSGLERSPRKFKLYSDFGNLGACYTGPPFRLMSGYLKGNPGYSGNIAIGSPSEKSFRKAKDQIKRAFSQDYEVDLSRIRFFWIRTEYDPEIHELWLVRRKSRRVS